MYGAIGNFPAAAVESMLDDLATHHCNAWYVNNINVQRLEELIPLAERMGVRIIPQGDSFRNLFYVTRKDGLKSEHRRQQFRETLVPIARKVVPHWRNRWGILSWALTEEVSPEVVAELSSYYALMRTLDGTHPPLILHNNPAAAAKDAAVNRAAVVFCDIYPFFIDCRSGPCTTERSLHYFRARLASYAAIARSSKVPLWVMMQAYGEPPEFDPEPPHFGHRGGRDVPTAAQLSVQMWLALSYGAKGLWWYGYHVGKASATAAKRHNWESTPIWDEIGKLHARVEKISSLLLRLEPATSPAVADVAGDGLHSTWHKVLDNPSEHYVIVVNQSLESSREVSIAPFSQGWRISEIVGNEPQDYHPRLLAPGEGAIFRLEPARR